MRVYLEEYVGESKVTVTLATKTATHAGGRYSGNIHCGGTLIGSVGETTNRSTLSSLPEKDVKTPASLVQIDRKHYVMFDNGTKIEAIPLRMS